MLDFHKIAEQKGLKEPIQDGSFADYHAGLKMYWQADYDGCVAYTAALLVKDSEQPYLLALYRLWAECLRASEAWSALRLLGSHLLREFQGSGEQQQDPRALRGLIHFSLDEQQACDLLAQGLQPLATCPYTLEFFQALQARTLDPDASPAVSLQASKGFFCDYFQWQTLAEELLAAKRSTELASVLDFVGRQYPGAPLWQEFKTRICMEGSLWQEAFGHAKLLQSRFPRKSEYCFLTAYCSRNLGLWSESIQALHMAESLRIEQGAEQDPDLYAELARGYAELVRGATAVAVHPREQRASREHGALALKYYSRAEQLYRILGLAYTQVAFQKEEFQAFLADSAVKTAQLAQPSASELKYWMVNLSQRRYHELSSAAHSDHDLVYWSLGAKAKKHDIVFFVVIDQILKEEDRWRLAAIYYAGADTVSHPLNSWQTALKLVKKIDFPLFLQFQSDNLGDRRQKQRLDDPAAYGAYELDAEAFAQIATHIEDVAQEHEVGDFKVILRKVS